MGLERFNSNAWFGTASKQLIDATIIELEAGHQARVLRSLQQLQRGYTPSYENRARYDVLIEEAVTAMHLGRERALTRHRRRPGSRSASP